ncbi:MAG: hypothetical protein K6F28_03950 [Lachnospiraceae bacterium]|nr:hypothetical protein [Lachnospiraceae bacterium]
MLDTPNERHGSIGARYVWLVLISGISLLISSIWMIWWVLEGHYLAVL